MILENEKGLSKDLVKILHNMLLIKAEKLKGREMIFELCQEIQDFLYHHNKPPAITKSFYEQRVESNQIQEIRCNKQTEIEAQLVIKLQTII
jgi:hypothetical protein